VAVSAWPCWIAPLARGEHAERFEQLEALRERNAQKIESRPEIVFENLTRRQSTFTRRDVAREVFRYIDEPERFGRLMARLEVSSELLQISDRVRDDRGNVLVAERYTTREMLAVESRLAERALEMADANTYPVSSHTRDRAFRRHSHLSDEQREAVQFITSPRQITALTGFAGAGKSAAIAAARDAWEAQGYRVVGGHFQKSPPRTWSVNRGLRVGPWRHGRKRGATVDGSSDERMCSSSTRPE
jgi:ATP-dependent exoDNAse (exonuclease V) alpha subunit